MGDGNTINLMWNKMTFTMFGQSREGISCREQVQGQEGKSEVLRPCVLPGWGSERGRRRRTGESTGAPGLREDLSGDET